MVKDAEAVPRAAPLKPHEILRAKRLEKGITLDKAREETKITYKYILALEEGNYKIFPAKVYLRGFFLSYCKYLGLQQDWENLWAQIEQAPVVPAPPVEVPLGRRINGAGENRGEALAESLWGRFTLWLLEGQNWIWVLVVIPAVLLAGFFGAYSYVQSRMQRLQPAPGVDVPSLLGHARMGKEGGLSVSGRPELSVKKLNPANRMALELSTKGEPSWIQVESDGEIVFQGILPARQKRVFGVSQAGKLRIGNPKTMDIKVNDAPWPLKSEDLEKTPLEIVITSEILPR